MRAFYFGSYPRRDDGHYLWSIGGGASWLDVNSKHNRGMCPFGAGEIDGKHVPKDCSQSATRLTCIEREDGWWHILAWHDYTGDSRPGSNSAIIVHHPDGRHTYPEMLMIGERIFPEVFKRLADNHTHLSLKETVTIPIVREATP